MKCGVRKAACNLVSDPRDLEILSAALSNHGSGYSLALLVKGYATLLSDQRRAWAKHH